MNTPVEAVQEDALVGSHKEANADQRALHLFDRDEFLWIIGFALALIFLTRHTRLNSLSPHWIHYLVLGSVFPIGLLLFSLVKPFHDATAAPSRVLRGLLALCFPILSWSFFSHNHSQNIVFLAEIQLLLTLVIFWVQKWQKIEKTDRASFVRHLPATSLKLLCYLFTTIVVWDVAAKMGWWYDLPKDALHYGSSAAFITVLLGFITWVLYWPNRVRFQRTKFVLLVIDVVALIFFVACSLSTHNLFNDDAFHHWSVWISPAEMVRQGSWLLWDVPSQYGFLSILTIAAIPFHSVWQSLYFGIMVAQVVAAAVVYALFRLRGASVRNALLALLIAWVAVFLAPGMAPLFSGPVVFPGSSPYRFVWCYALLGLLAWEYHTGRDVPRRSTFFVGTAIWLIGVFWSAESAIYCTLTWIPAYGLLLWRRRPMPRFVFSGLAAAFALLGFALALLRLYYRVRLGHGPDWFAFVEYGMAFKNGFSAWPLDPAGPVWVLVLSLCAVSAAAVFLLRHGGASHRAAAIVTGAWGASWATSSYFMSRSHPNNVDNLLPFCCAAMAVTLFVYADQQRAEGYLLKAVFIPILACMIYMTVGNGPEIALYPATLAQGYDRSVVNKLPVADASLVQLLSQAHVKPSDPIVYLNLNHMPTWTYSDGKNTRLISTPRAWMPIMPYSLMQPITVQRQGEYMARFAAQTHLSGWYIEPKTNINLAYGAHTVDVGTTQKIQADFRQLLLQTHTPGQVLENPDYQMTWYQYRPPTVGEQH